jgi:light-regulated signal transduction histidine kinase (bacteriophytochrome)
MQNAALRMRQLIESLLQYSRIAHSSVHLEEVDLNRVVESALSDLEIKIAEKKAKIVVGSLPVLFADSTQMHQLFLNLIGNSLKFHRAGHPPQIEIGSLGKNNHFIVWVKDNGIGFEKKYHSIIFQPFRRLHGRGQFEGVGMGLAICQKIVERHGGILSAESVPSEGSTFYVKFPLSTVGRMK